LIASKIILAIGLVFAVEGFIVALFPSYLQNLLKVLIEIPSDNRRLLGFTALMLGTGLVWISTKVI
jgi:uncharacterized protein YjeT (DUF2065 family)